MALKSKKCIKESANLVAKLREYSPYINHNYTLLGLLVFSFFMWGLGLNFLLIPLLGLYCLTVFLSSDDPKSVFAVIFAGPFFLNNIADSTSYYFYAIGAICVFVGVIYFLVRKLSIEKVEVTKGKMFWAFVAFTIASVLGGIVGYFNIVTTICIFAMCVVFYVMYFIMLNFCSGLKVFWRRFFIVFGIELILQLFFLHAMSDDFFASLTSKSIFFVGAQNINTLAVYLLLAMLSMFWLAYEDKKHDYLYCLGAIAFAGTIFLAYSRINTLLAFLFALVSFIIVFVKSPHKKLFGICAGIVATGVLFMCVVFWDNLVDLISWYIKLGFSGNGRDILWPWCFKEFLKHPIFGVGFVSYEGLVPTVASNIVIMAHNDLLQSLVSTGIVGSIFMLYFYVKKYSIVIGRKSDFDTFTFINVLFLTCVGIVDQCTTMDPFVMLIGFMLVVIAEQFGSERSKAPVSPITDTPATQKE